MNWYIWTAGLVVAGTGAFMARVQGNPETGVWITGFGILLIVIGLIF